MAKKTSTKPAKEKAAVKTQAVKKTQNPLESLASINYRSDMPVFHPGDKIVVRSKIKEGDTIHYVLKKTGKEREANRYSALRVMVIPQEYFIN